jgi:hypothetical protein
LFEENKEFEPEKPRTFSNKRKKTVTRTFRISADWDEILRKEAERQGISVNSLVNLILRKYACFDRLCRGRNYISLTKHAFHEILEGIPLERLALAGENTGSKDVQDILDMLGLPSNYDSFAYLLTKHFGGTDRAMWFNCYRYQHENLDLFHLQHNLGREWSVYLQKYFLSFLKTLKVDYDTKIYDYAVNIRVLRPHSPDKAH